MKGLLFDTNIILDWLLNRAPFSIPATELTGRAARGLIRAYVTATTLNDIFYFLRKAYGIDQARQEIGDLLRLFVVLPVDRATVQAALAGPIRDLEDAIQDAAAERAGIPILVTRDPKGFAGSTRRILDAQAVLDELDRPAP